MQMGNWNAGQAAICLLACTSVASELVVLPAVGRTARIGELYDAVTDTFRDITVFRKEWNSSIVKTLDTPMSDARQMRVTKLRDKANLLRVTATITVGIYCGLIELSGTAEYIREEKESSSTQSQVFSYSVRTKRDILEDYEEDLLEFISEEALSLDATHVVTAVDYGADVFIEFNAKNLTENKREEIYGELALYFRKFEAIANAKASASVEYDVFEDIIDQALSIRILGDLAITNRYPLTLIEVAEFLRTVPKLVRQENGAKGNPISYTIAPIEQFRKKFGSSLLSLPRRANSVNETESYEFLIIFEEIEDVRARMNEMSDQFKINEDFIPIESITNLEEVKFSFEEVVLSLKKNVSAGLILVREGNDMAMTKIKQDYEANPFSAAKVSTKLRTEYEAALEKSVEVDSFRKHDIEVLGRSGSVQDFLLKYPDQIIQMLFMTPSYKSDSNWASTVALLLRPLKNPLNKLVMVDCSFLSPFCPETSVIKQFYNGKVLSEDVFHDISQQQGNTLEMVGIGAEIKLGDLFDVRTGKFTGTTVLDYFDPDAEFEDDDDSLEYSHLVAENFDDLFGKLRIPRWQGIDMLASGEDIFGFKSSEEKPSGFACFIRRNSTRKLSLTSKPTFVETDVVFQKEVTHYVSGMDIATINIIKFLTGVNPDKDQWSIRSELEEDMEKFRALFQRFQEDGADITQLDLSLKYSQIQIFTNFRGFPLEFESLASLLEHLSQPEYADAEPLFLPIRLTLQPVSSLHEALKFVIPVPRYIEMSDASAIGVIKVFDQIQRSSSHLQEFRTLFQTYRQVARDQDYKKLLEVSLRLDAEAEDWKSAINTVLQQVKHSEEKEDVLENVISLFWAGDVGKLSHAYFESEFPLVSKKLATASKAHNLGVRYLGRADWFQEIFMAQRINASVAMVNFTSLNEERELDNWMESIDGVAAFLVDCDFFPVECLGTEGFEERKYSHGVLNLEVSQEGLVKDIQIEVNCLAKEMGLISRNLTRHYEVLKDFTENILTA